MLRDELLRGEIFYSLREAEVLIESWLRHYNTRRPHSATDHLRQRSRYGRIAAPIQKRIQGPNVSIGEITDMHIPHGDHWPPMVNQCVCPLTRTILRTL
jgi:hypothetical protein